jgi:hypothetical protein
MHFQIHLIKLIEIICSLKQLFFQIIRKLKFFTNKMAKIYFYLDQYEQFNEFN